MNVRRCYQLTLQRPTQGPLERHPALAADLLWTLTSLRTWEDLVLERGWTAAEYEKRVTDRVLDALTEKK